MQKILSYKRLEEVHERFMKFSENDDRLLKIQFLIHSRQGIVLG